MMVLDVQRGCWAIWPIIVPLFWALISFVVSKRPRLPGMLGAFSTSFLAGILCWQLVADGLCRYNLGGWLPPLGISLRADGPAVIMVLMTAVTGLAISIYAGGYFQSRRAGRVNGWRHIVQERSFWPLWLLLWAGLNGLFLSADIFNIYVAIELVALSSVGLTALSGKPPSQVAAMRYLLISLLGSFSFLLGVAFLYKACGSLDLAIIHASLSKRPSFVMAMGLVSVGLMLKTALFPFHFWLPPAHANALAPVSAILSGLVIKGSWYLFFRFWQGVLPLTGPDGSIVLALLGGAAITWGALQALSQQRLKMLVAYSTVAQVGYLFIIFPLLVTGPEQGSAAVFYFAISHSCAKAAMFLAAGTIFVQMGHDRIDDLAGVRQLLPITTFAFALGGLSLMGLPPSGGFIAKYMYINQAISQQMWWLVAIMIVGSCLTALYVYRAVSRILSPRLKKKPGRLVVGASMEWSALALALVAVLLGFIAPLPLAVFEVMG